MKRLINWIMPKETRFFDLLCKQSENVVAGAHIFNKLVSDFHKLSKDERKDLAKQIKEIERNGDNILHGILDELNMTFLTPFDREDVHHITEVMDDVIDIINGAAKRIILYNIDTLTPEIEELNEILLSCVTELNLSVKELSKPKNIHEHSIKINSLENRADVVSMRGIAFLFETESHDPVKIIKYKEIIELLEKVIDKCEAIPNIFSNLVVKHT